jgi:hypothetical protein
MDASQNGDDRTLAGTEAQAIEWATKRIFSHIDRANFQTFEHIKRHIQALASDMRNVVQMENKVNQADFRPNDYHRQVLRMRVYKLGEEFAEKVVDEILRSSPK